MKKVIVTSAIAFTIVGCGGNDGESIDQNQNDEILDKSYFVPIKVFKVITTQENDGTPVIKNQEIFTVDLKLENIFGPGVTTFSLKYSELPNYNPVEPEFKIFELVCSTYLVDCNKGFTCEVEREETDYFYLSCYGYSVVTESYSLELVKEKPIQIDKFKYLVGISLRTIPDKQIIKSFQDSRYIEILYQKTAF